jgi:RNA methyltransferase, TrmH family
MELVSSVQNKVYKHLKKLIDKSSYRKEEALFVVEGLREINIAIKSGFLPEMLIDCPEIPYQSDEGFLPNPALKTSLILIKNSFNP